MRKIINPWKGKEGYNCFGCCPDNPLGVHMEFFEDGDKIISFWRPQHHYQGWVNTIHGGILATLIDETAGWVVFRKLQTSGMTTRLDLRYKKAVSTQESQITLRGELIDCKHHLATIHVVLENSHNETCVEGNVVYYVMDSDKAKAMGFEHCDLEGDAMLPF